MVIADKVQYADIFKLVSEAERRLGRKVSPTVVAPADLAKRRGEDSFHSRVLEQAKIFVMGSEDDLGKPRKTRKGKAAQG